MRMTTTTTSVLIRVTYLLSKMTLRTRHRIQHRVRLAYMIVPQKTDSLHSVSSAQKPTNSSPLHLHSPPSATATATTVIDRQLEMAHLPPWRSSAAAAFFCSADEAAHVFVSLDSSSHAEESVSNRQRQSLLSAADSCSPPKGAKPLDGMHHIEKY
jgi:hypothetical protein